MTAMTMLAGERESPGASMMEIAALAIADKLTGHEFEVRNPDAVQSAAEELRQRGFTLLHDAREEPWGQTVAYLRDKDGHIVALCTPLP